MITSPKRAGSMKNKLHIFGCSHSGNIYDLESGNKLMFWGNYLADKLDLELFPRVGHAGKNSEYILMDIFDRILNNYISKNDYVILNTSHALRFGTPRLQKYIKHPMDVNFDSEHILGIKTKNSLKVDELKQDLTFDLWYKQTFGAWKILNSVSNHVYQWLLDEKDDMEFTYIEIQKCFKKENSNTTDYQMENYPLKELNFNSNSWTNLLNPSIEYNSWWDWIKNHKRSENNWHLHPDSHSEFAELLYKQIKEYEIHN
jgi:hypothetical protein